MFNDNRQNNDNRHKTNDIIFKTPYRKLRFYNSLMLSKDHTLKIYTYIQKYSMQICYIDTLISCRYEFKHFAMNNYLEVVYRKRVSSTFSHIFTHFSTFFHPHHYISQNSCHKLHCIKEKKGIPRTLYQETQSHKIEKN